MLQRILVCKYAFICIVGQGKEKLYQKALRAYSLEQRSTRQFFDGNEL